MVGIVIKSGELTGLACQRDCGLGLLGENSANNTDSKESTGNFPESLPAAGGAAGTLSWHEGGGAGNSAGGYDS